MASATSIRELLKDTVGPSDGSQPSFKIKEVSMEKAMASTGEFGRIWR